MLFFINKIAAKA